MPNQDYTKWHLPKGTKARLGKGWIKAIAYSPDSTRLAVASSIGIWIYETHTYKELALFTEHTGSVEGLTYSPDGDTIATGSEDVRLWDAATGKHKSTLTGHADRIESVVYSPDGKTIAAKVGHHLPIGGNFIRYSVHLWDAATEKYITTLTENLHGVYSVAFSPDGKTIATGTYGKVLLWDAVTGEHKTTLTGHTHGIESISYSPDGKTIATSSGIFGEEVHLWNATTGQHNDTLTERGDSVMYSPDGKIIAIVSLFTISLWDAVTGEHKDTLTIPTDSVKSSTYSPDGKTIATGTHEVVHLWDTATGEHKARLIGHAKSVKNVAYSPDGKTIATDCYDLNLSERVHLWDVATRKHKTTQDKVVYSPDGKTIATWGSEKGRNQNVCLWDTITWQHKATLTEHADRISSIVYNPDSKTIIIWSEDLEYPEEADPFFGPFLRECKVNLWDTITGKHKATLSEHTVSIEYLVYSPDGDTIAIWSWEENKSQEVRLWDTTIGKQIATLMGSTRAFSIDKNVVYSPDSKTIAIRSDKDVCLWDTATGEHKATFTGHTDNIENVVYSPNGKTIAIGSCEKVCLWDASTGRRVRDITTGEYDFRFTGEEGFVYSPDGCVILTWGYGKVCLWDATTGKQIATLTEHINILDTIENVAYGPDGHTIAISCYSRFYEVYDSKVHLWDAATGQYKAMLTGNSTAYSPDGKTIATKSDQEVNLWDAITGERKATLTHGHFGHLISFAYSPDGKTIATGGDDGTVLLWDLAPHNLHIGMNINPREIHGNWRRGWTLDTHTLSSRPLPGGGYDTERTEFGELVFQLKYRHDRSKIQPIAEIATKFVEEKFAVDGHLVLPYLAAVIPIPPSDTNRAFQPVTEVVREIGKLLNVPVRTDYLMKVKRTELLKNLPDVESKREQLRGAFAVRSQDLKNLCVLLVDDLYDSGTTLTEATKVLYEQGGVKHVLVLTLTRTRTGRD